MSADISEAGHFPLIIGHRGASGVAPENTLAAFARALEDGADGIEFDVRLARDRVPIIIHDATLQRTGLRDGAVSALTSDELSEVDVGTWFDQKHAPSTHASFARERIPTLAQVFEQFGSRCRVSYVEMKCAEAESDALALEVVQLIRAHDLAQRVVVESFTLDSIKEIKRLAPEVRTAALFERRLARPLPSPRRILAQALECQADEIALHHSLASRAMIEAATGAGLQTVVWTIDDSSWAERAVALGLKAIITNYPATMCAARDARRSGS